MAACSKGNREGAMETGGSNVTSSDIDPAVGAAASSSLTLSCRHSSFPFPSRCSPFSTSSAKKEANSAPLIKSRSASLNKASYGKAEARARGGGGNSSGGTSARLAELSPCTAAPGEVNRRFVPRGEGTWRENCPLQPNGACAACGGMGSINEATEAEGGVGSAG